MRIQAVKRQIASTPSVNKIRDFNSGILKQLANVLTMERNMRQNLIQAIKRQIASKPRVNKIRDFSPGILKMLVMERNMR
jgi:pheromone shutdown protein TraB